MNKLIEIDLENHVLTIDLKSKYCELFYKHSFPEGKLAFVRSLDEYETPMIIKAYLKGVENGKSSRG